MAKSYSQIVEEIESLKRQAEAARAKEVAGVVARIREAIDVYGITAKDLGLSGLGQSRTKASSKSKASAKFADQQGNTWVGRGKRPAWLNEAFAAGKSLEDFAVDRSSLHRSKAVKAAKVGRKKTQKRASVPAKYKDSEGNTWSGRGSQPRWLVAAIANGKKLESMAV